MSNPLSPPTVDDADSVRRLVLLPLFGALLSLLLAFWGATYWVDQHIKTRILQQETGNVARQLQQAMAEQALVFKQQMLLLTHSDSLRRAFLAGDREALLRESKPILDSLQEDHVTHFSFHRPDRRVLLRVHNPDQHDDQINRRTLLQAEQSGGFVFGAEIGRVGALTLRAVMPWQDGTSLLGYLELGKEVEHFIVDLQGLFGRTFYTFLHREYLDATHWRDASKQFGIRLDWDSFANLVFIGPESFRYPDGLREYVASAVWQAEKTQNTIAPAFGTEHGYFFAIPIRDVQNRVVCHIVGMTDFAEHPLLMQHYTLIVIGVTSVVVLLLGVFLNHLLRGMERKIRFTSQALRCSNENLTSSQAMLHNTLESLADGIVVVNSLRFVLHANARFAAIWNFPERLQLPMDQEILLDHIQRQLVNPTPLLAHLQTVPPDSPSLHGTLSCLDGRSLEYHSFPAPCTQGLCGRVWVFHDITRRAMMEHREEHAAQSRLAITALLETGMASISLDQQLSAALEIILGVPWLSLEYKGAIFLLEEGGQQLVLATQHGLSPHLLVRCAQVPLGYCLCGRAALRRESLFVAHIDTDHDIIVPDMQPHGHYCVPILLGERLLGVLTLYVPDGYVRNSEEEAFLTTVSYTLANLIERRTTEQLLQHIAGHDSLTNLPNRAMFQIRLKEALSMAARSKAEVVLLFLDLDRFKLVNDTMGHKAGDELLKEATRRILSCMRQYDVVARLGGDEFTVILPQVTHIAYVEFIARRILEELARPFILAEGEANVSGSIGITLFPRDALDMESLLRNADTAMYCAKAAGRNTFCFFTESMQDAAMNRMRMEEKLRTALKNQEFMLHYQPKLDLVSGQINGMEALVRWQQSDETGGEGVLLPEAFIHIAEETGLITPLGAWVLASACRQNKAWQEQGLPPMRVAVNLSANQFRHTEILLETVAQALRDTQLDPAFLELEITESMVMENVNQAVRTLNALQEMGVTISMDDFGTGYSSMGSLKKFPIHDLKIDRLFIRDLSTATSDEAAIVQAMIAMAKKLHMRVIAEGVETQEQWDFLHEQGCDTIQGYHFSHPLPAADFAVFLQQHRDKIPGGANDVIAGIIPELDAVTESVR